MEREYKINNSTITIKIGSIIESKAEVIVSSDDYMLSMGGGVSATIRNAAGEDILIDARKKIPAILGDIVVTTAGDLSQKFIFHAITIDGNSLRKFTGSQLQKEELQQSIIFGTIKKAFRLMAALDLDTIAFPAIGAGVACIPYVKVAQCMGEAFAEILTKTNRTYKIELYLYDRFNHMSQWDFLPFFESLAQAKQYSIIKLSTAFISDDEDSMDITINKPNLNQAADVFISYSRKDIAEVKGICDLLNEMGVSYWIDVNGEYSGKNFKEVIVKAIDEAKLVLFVSSKNSNDSINVAKEINIADSKNKKILPIKLDETPYAPQIAYDMVNIDYVEYHKEHVNTTEKLRRAIASNLFIIEKRWVIN